MRRRPLISILSFAAGATLITSGLFTQTASASSQLHATVTYPAALMSGVPLARLHFDGAVDASKLPSVNTYPSLSVTWQQIGSHDVQAVTRSALIPASSYLVNVPNVVSCSSQHCTAVSRTVKALSAVGSVQWLQQLLAHLGYMPVSFIPTHSGWTYTRPTTGIFLWKFNSLPLSLRAQWHVGLFGAITKGALMHFQYVAHLGTTGVADATTWRTLIAAASTNTIFKGAYNYVDVTMSRPETLTLYSNGAVVFRTTINTGIPQSPTASGTYPVYLRFTSTTMSGTNPDGSHYHDTGIPWVSYFNGGDALHGFIRSSYGWPQSLGCVEMRYNDAKVVYPYTPIGTLVTVR